MVRARRSSTLPERSGAAPARSDAAYVEAVNTYYMETWKDYRGTWMNPQNRAMHFGYWDASTRTHAQSLLTMNQVLARHAALRRGDRVLDAGCGVGGTAMWLAEEYEARVVGITLVADQVARARRYADERGLGQRVCFLQRDYLHTGFPPASFDVVWCQESLSHAPDKQAFFTEAYRVLKPGGRLVVSDYFRFRERDTGTDERIMQSWLSGWFMPSLLTGEGAVACARRAGLEDVRLEDITLPARRSLRRLYLVAVYFYPFIYPLHLLGFRSAVQHGNARASFDQWRAIKRGLWFLGILSGRKPTGEGPAP